MVYCFDVPFEQNPFIWKQDFTGKIQGKVLTYPLNLRPDYSNDVQTLFNTEAFYTSVSTYFEQTDDTLYHYYPETDNLKPVFSLNMGKQKHNHHYINTPLNIFVGLSSGVNKNNGPYSTARYDLMKVDKQTHDVQIRYGHICTWIEPTELMNDLDEVLATTELKQEVSVLCAAWQNSYCI